MENNCDGFKEVFTFQMGWREYLMEFQPLFGESNAFLDEQGRRAISLVPVYALIELMAKKRGFTILDTHYLDWSQDKIFIYEKL